MSDSTPSTSSSATPAAVSTPSADNTASSSASQSQASPSSSSASHTTPTSFKSARYLTPPLDKLHAAIRDSAVNVKSTLRPTTPPHTGLSPRLVQEYTQPLQAAKNEAEVHKELQRKHTPTHSTISLRPTLPSRSDSVKFRDVQEAYRQEQEQEAELLTENSKHLRPLHLSPIPGPPREVGDVSAISLGEGGSSSAAASSSSESSIPPPPTAEYLTSITNPRHRINLTPVFVQHSQDGPNAGLMTLSIIESKHVDVKQKLKPTTPLPPRDYFQTEEYSKEARKQSMDLDRTLKKNEALLEELRIASTPSPSYPIQEERLSVTSASDDSIPPPPLSPASPSSSSSIIKPKPTPSELTSTKSTLHPAQTHETSYNERIHQVKMDVNKEEREEKKEKESSFQLPDLRSFCHRPPTARYIIGVMSGTSLDGVDAVVADFGTKTSTAPGKLIAHHFLPMPQELRKKILQLNTPSNITAASGITNDSEFIDTILAVANHGQTVRHRPSDYHYTVQLGNHSLLAELLSLPVIADFRSRDVAAGGQGAPLVPKFHWEWFGGGGGGGGGGSGDNKKEDLCIVNIGGIANLSYISSNKHASSSSSSSSSSTSSNISNTTATTVLGYDTGPGNVLSDLWYVKCHPSSSSSSYDTNGDFAHRGTVIQSLLDVMLQEEYFSLPTPKSTGRDLFHEEWLKRIMKKAGIEWQDVAVGVSSSSSSLTSTHKPADIAATIIELTAKTIADEINKCAQAKGNGGAATSSSSSSSPHPSVYICGGGAYNTHLLSRLQFHLPYSTVATTLQKGLTPDSVEAMAFAWMGWMFLQGRATNLPAVTGAKGERVLGVYYPA